MSTHALIQACFDLFVAGIFLTIVWIVIGMVAVLAPFKQIIMLLFTLICVVVLFNILSPLFEGGHLLGHGC